MADPALDLAQPIYLGSRRRIFAYRAGNGRVPAVEFLEELEESARARYIIRFKQMGDEGNLPGKFWHPWSDRRNKNARGLSGFKDNQSQSRIPAFSDDSERGVMVLTHGFGGKKEDDIDDAEINEAAQIRRDYGARKAATAARESQGGSPKRDGKKGKNR